MNYLLIIIIGRKSPLSLPLVLIFWLGVWSSVDVVTNSTFAPLCNKKRNFVVPLHDGLAAWSGLLLDNNNFVFVMGKQTQECVSPSSPGFLYVGEDRSQTKTPNSSINHVFIMYILSYCEAQGKGRARGRPRKVTQRSFMDGGWWMVDILSLELYTKVGCHPPTGSLITLD